MDKKRLARVTNKVLKYIEVAICYRVDKEKFFLIRKKCKKYEGDWSTGCYISLPKCASSSIARTLGQINSHPQNEANPSYEQPWVYRTEAPPFDLDRIKANSSLNEFEKSNDVLSQHLNLEDEKTKENVYYFSVVRNPYSRIHGAWQECREIYEIRLTFKEFLYYVKRVYDNRFDMSELEGERGTLDAKAWWHCRPQLEQLLDNKNKLVLHSIARMESLESDIRKTLSGFRTFFPKPFLLYHSNSKPDGSSQKRSGRGYRQYYDEESRRLVEEMYWSDLDYFGYRF